MNKTLFMILMGFIGTGCFAQQTQFDSTLAKSLGADDYGMKSYVLAILVTGTNLTDNQAVRDSLFRGHMDNINRLADAGNLVIAGPLGKNNKAYRGIFILNTSSIDQAKEWLDGDAAITAKIFDVEYFNWYGSAALPAYLPVHSKIEKIKH